MSQKLRWDRYQCLARRHRYTDSGYIDNLLSCQQIVRFAISLHHNDFQCFGASNNLTACKQYCFSHRRTTCGTDRFGLCRQHVQVFIPTLITATPESSLCIQGNTDIRVSMPGTWKALTEATVAFIASRIRRFMEVDRSTTIAISALVSMPSSLG